MSIEAMKAARDYIRDVPPDAFFGALSRGTSVLAKLNEAIAAVEKAEPMANSASAQFEAMHARGIVWISTIAAAKLVQKAEPASALAVRKAAPLTAPPKD